MSDDIDRLLREADGGGGDSTDSTTEFDETLVGDGDLGDLETVGPADQGPGLGRRVFGLLALLLGAIGVVLSLVLIAMSVRLLFTASGTAERLMEPVASTYDRLEDRIDETDDLIDRDGMEGARVAELQARVDGLVDVTNAAERGFDAVDSHPVYRYLPIDLSPLGSTLDDFEAAAEDIDGSLGSSNDVRPSVAASIADEVNDMQSRVSDARPRLQEATDSLRGGLRLGGLIGFLGGLWGLWGQAVLARRGLRGLLGRPL